jgi:hypothetical protein
MTIHRLEPLLATPYIEIIEDRKFQKRKSRRWRERSEKKRYREIQEGMD